MKFTPMQHVHGYPPFSLGVCLSVRCCWRLEKSFQCRATSQIQSSHLQRAGEREFLSAFESGLNSKSKGSEGKCCEKSNQNQDVCMSPYIINMIQTIL